MALTKITRDGHKCLRCTHQWVPRKSTKGDPKVCPKCKSPYWNKVRKSKKSTRHV